MYPNAPVQWVEIHSEREFLLLYGTDKKTYHMETHVHRIMNEEIVPAFWVQWTVQNYEKNYLNFLTLSFDIKSDHYHS